MPTPRSGYFLSDGTKVPGTTSIIGRWKESGGLIRWAYNQGREHERLSWQGKEAPRHLYDKVEEAADIGTIAHRAVELHVDGEKEVDLWEVVHDEYPEATNEMWDRAGDAFDAYLNWERQTKLEIVDQEMQLVSEKYQYGGTPDALIKIDNKLCVGDYKTSNKIYADYLVQVSAYRNLIEENMGVEITGGFHILRFAKEHGDFAHHYFPNLDEAWEQFKLFRQAYDIDKQLKKRAA